jgi:serine/threonine-protein kinase
MVKKAAKAATDVDTLYRLLADEVSSQEDRTQFLASRKQVAGSSGTSMSTASSTTLSPAQTTGPVTRVTSEMVEQAARRLAPHVGPIAKVLAKKAAAKAQDSRQFHLLLAENITSESDRNRFLKDVGLLS